MQVGTSSVAWCSLCKIEDILLWRAQLLCKLSTPHIRWAGGLPHVWAANSACGPGAYASCMTARILLVVAMRERRFD